MIDFKWFKFGIGMFNDSKIKIIETHEEADIILCVWFKSLCLAGIVNDSGYMYINEETPYTLKTLAIEFNRPLDKVKTAIKVLIKLQMIEITEDRFYKVKNWTRYQNVDALEKQRAETSKRVAKYRAKKKLQKDENKNPDDNSGDDNVDDLEEDKENKHDKTDSNNNGQNINTSDGNNEIQEEDILIDENNNVNNDCEDKAAIKNNDKPLEDKESVPLSKIIDIDRKVISNNEDKIIHNTDNVTCNNEVTGNNVTVTDKIERETKSQSKKENKKESECKSNDDSLNESCARILNYYESITGLVGALNIGTLKLSIDMHGEKHVKLAMEKAIECGKTNITYINGILKNWKREGYPNEKDEVKVNGGKRNNKGNTADKSEFAGFKPKKPKQLTNEERRKIEANLI